MTKQKFIVGQTYPFRCVKKVLLDEEYFVFEDPDGARYLLPAYYYRNYGIEYGKNIQCRILRVDCSGKVSIEPEHAYYKTGCVYGFDFKEVKVIKEENTRKYSGTQKPKKTFYLVVIDRFGNEHLVKAAKSQQNKNFRTEKISCKVKSITKGNLELESVESKRGFISRILNK